MDSENNGSRTDPKIGRKLERARKEQGLSLKQVEQATKIRARYLEELERGNFGVLPTVYVQGFLKTYANHLGLNGEALSRGLKRWQASQHKQELLIHTQPSKAGVDRPLILPGHPASADDRRGTTENEGDARSTLIPVGSNRELYLAMGAFLVFVVAAVTIVWTSVGNTRTAVSQVSAPTVFPAPLASPGENEGAPQQGGEQSAKDQAKSGQTSQLASTQEENHGAAQSELSGREEGIVGQVQGSQGTAVTSSAPTTIEAPPATAQPQLPSIPTAKHSSPMTRPSALTRAAPAPTQPHPTPTPPTPTTAEPVPAATHSAPTPTEAPIPDNQGAVTNARAHVPVNDGDKAATNANSTQETIDACPVEVLSVSGVSRVEVTTIGGVEGDHAACAFRASYSPFDTAGKGLSISKWSSATASMKIP